jgi:hypothetical protein
VLDLTALQNIMSLYSEIQSCNSNPTNGSVAATKNPSPPWPTTDAAARTSSNASNDYAKLSLSVSLGELAACPAVVARLLAAFGLGRIFSVELLDDAELWFKMLSGDWTRLGAGSTNQ